MKKIFMCGLSGGLAITAIAYVFHGHAPGATYAQHEANGLIALGTAVAAALTWRAGIRGDD